MVDHQDGFKTMAGGTTETSFEFHVQEGDFLLWTLVICYIMFLDQQNQFRLYEIFYIFQSYT